MALHILVVDDDADVLTVLVEMLREAGFIVTSADSGAAMRDILGQERRPQIDVVILDCKMPGEPSTALALHAKALRLPVVMISGHVEAMEFAAQHGLQLLEKPFRTPELLGAIDAALRSGEFGQREA